MKCATRIILDTDIGNDVDDVLALAVLHSLHAESKCELLGVMVNKANDYAPKMTDAINTFYGHGHVPVGMVNGNQPTPHVGPFNEVVSKMCDDNGQVIFPRTHRNYPSAVSLYRRLLSESPDYSVRIASVGFLTNLASLLGSQPDEYSELSGRELLRKKVCQLAVMAGDFSQPVLDNPRVKEHLEYNIAHDIPAARVVCKHWPTEIVFCGYELGLAIRYPATSIESDYAWAANHPLVECYKLFAAMPYDRPAWDPITAMYAAGNHGDCFSLSQPGQFVVHEDGYASFEALAGGQHRYLICDERQRNRIRELIVALCSRPPKTAKHWRPRTQEISANVLL